MPAPGVFEQQFAQWMILTDSYAAALERWLRGQVEAREEGLRLQAAILALEQQTRLH